MWYKCNSLQLYIAKPQYFFITPPIFCSIKRKRKAPAGQERWPIAGGRFPLPSRWTEREERRRGERFLVVQWNPSLTKFELIVRQIKPVSYSYFIVKPKPCILLRPRTKDCFQFVQSTVEPAATWVVCSHSVITYLLCFFPIIIYSFSAFPFLIINYCA